MPTIKKMGRFLPLDEDGYIQNICRIDKVVSPWKEIVEEVVQLYIRELGDGLHSVYLRGSVAKGEAVPFVSDVDTIALIKTDVDKIDRNWKKAYQEKVQQKYDFCTGVELHLVNYNNLPKHPKRENYHFLFKTQCLCIWGDDITLQLPSFRIGKLAIAHSFNFAQERSEIIKELQDVDLPASEIPIISEWMAKRMVRIGLELLMQETQLFTRDLYPCYEVFSQHYPHKQAEMYQVLEYAINPVHDKDLLLDCFQGFGLWLEEEIVRQLDRFADRG